MSSVCMKYPICSETKGALLLKFHFHTPPPLPPARPPDTLPSSHPAQPAQDRARVRSRRAGSGQPGSRGQRPGHSQLLRRRVWCPATGEGATKGKENRAFQGEGTSGSLGWSVAEWGWRWPFLRAPVGPGPWQGLAVWDGNARSPVN